MGVGDRSGVGLGYELILAAVHEQQCPGGELTGVAGGYYSIPCGTQGCTINCPSQVTCPPRTGTCPI